MQKLLPNSTVFSLDETNATRISNGGSLLLVIAEILTLLDTLSPFDFKTVKFL